MKHIFCSSLLSFAIFILSTLHADNEYTVKLLKGNKLNSVKKDIAQLIVQEFAGYPYLSKGTLEEALFQADWFVQLIHSAVAIVLYNDELVGFAAGSSFNEYAQYYENSIDVFSCNGLNSDEYFYLSQVIIKPEHRGKGLTAQLFKNLEYHTRSQGYTKICLLCESHAEHPLKPQNYRELDSLWIKLGYIKTSIDYHHSWLTIQSDGSAQEQIHAMRYWVKDL